MNLRLQTPSRRLATMAVAALAGAVLASALVACGDDSTGDDAVVLDPATTSVVYAFYDASVAPDYHRSYTVTVTADSARVVVDSYGDVLFDVTEPIDDALWQRTLATAAEFSSAKSVTNEGCAGGTAEQLLVIDGAGQNVFEVFVDHCDTSGGPNVVEAVGEVLPMFDMDTMLETE
jgi:hypothetical protein